MQPEDRGFDERIEASSQSLCLTIIQKMLKQVKAAEAAELVMCLGCLSQHFYQKYDLFQLRHVNPLKHIVSGGFFSNRQIDLKSFSALLFINKQVQLK